MSRQEILARIRRSLDATRTSDVNRRTAAQERYLQPVRHLIPARGRGTPDELVTRLFDEFKRHSIDVIRVSGRAKIPDAIMDFLDQHKIPRRLRMGDHPLYATLPWARTPGLEVSKGAAHGDDRVGLSHALAGVAETGTLVLASGKDNPASLAFLPETHIVTLAESTIVGAFEDAIDLVRGTYGPGGLPRSLNFISGPSRTGDIGGRIVLGAHGPRRLAAIVFNDE